MSASSSGGELRETPVNEKTARGESGGLSVRENLVGDYFCASARRFTTIPEKRTM